jgi:hypothetical protein
MLRKIGALSVSLQYGIENKFQQRKLNVQKGSTGSILATLGPPLYVDCVPGPARPGIGVTPVSRRCPMRWWALSNEMVGAVQ